MRKPGRKILSALLTLALLVSLLPLGAAPAQAEGLTIKINSEKELWDFSYALSQNTPGYANANVSLEGDIDVAISSWVPIGTHEAPAMDPIAFTGTFDGNGHTIKNIHIVDRTYNPTSAGDYRSSADVGLFACLDSGGTVKNLKVTGSVSGGERGVNVGGIVGVNSGGSVTNCTFSGSVSGGSAMNVGGIVGQNSGSVTNCTFSSGSLSGSGNVGGVVGQNSGSVTDCANSGSFNISGSGNFGGVVGNNSGSVAGCSNSGRISVPMTNPPSSASGNLGGVVGQNSGAGARITSCYNTGDLLYYSDPFTRGPFISGNLGGVVGSNSGNSSVTNSYSTGNIGSDNNNTPAFGTFGGVVGSNSESSSVTNCYNSGKFGKSLNGTVGGVVGNNGATVDKCYFLQQDNVPAQGIGNDNTHTDAIAVDNLTDQTQFKDWDFDNIWRISQSLNRPVLQENAQDGLPPGLGTADSPYRISTADQLKSFRDIVNDVDGNPAAHAELMNDIDLNPGMEISADGTVTGDPEQWEPIGSSEENAYACTFDGNGKTIENLYINSSDNYQGLFGYVDQGGTVQNLGVSGSVTVTGGTSNVYEGGIVGENSGGRVENCAFSGNVSATGGYSYVGGVVGDNSGIVQNCYNTGKVTGSGSGSMSGIGGVVGFNNSGATIQNCYNTGRVANIASGSYTVYVGGVVGNNFNNASVTNCYFLQTADVNKDLQGIGINIGSGDATAKDGTQFASGEVAWRLQNGQTDGSSQVWGQNLTDGDATKDDSPQLRAFDADTPQVYKVAFMNDSEEYDAKYANSSMTVSLPKDPGIANYIFDGWFDNEACEGEALTGPITVVDKDITFYAKLTPYEYSIIASPSALDFGSITEGEERPASQTVTITNSGNQPLTLNQPASTNSFVVGELSKTTLAPNATATFTVQPKADLSAGSYSEEITITGSEVILEIKATLTVSASEPEPTPEPDPDPDPDPTPSGPATDGSSGWDDIRDELEDAAKGDEITIDMGDETKVPAEIFETIAGKDVDVTFDLGDVQWSVNGADIPADTDFTDLDLGVSLDTHGIPVNVVNAITGEVGTVQITLAHDGEFGFAMTLSAPLGEENAGYWANLYHYDEDAEALQFEAAAKIDEDGNVKIPFSHASQYAIVIDDHSHAAVSVSDLFIDIAANAWYKDAVQYAYDHGLMTGTSANEFAPEQTTTRAMIVSILARLENVTSAESAGFADVNDEWYATAVNWAANVGVVNGYEDNTFRPNTAITREQLAAILMNYASYKGQDVSARADLTSYTDQPSAWAEEAMQWAVAEGLISGVTNTELQPQGNATRAQVAAILQRFLCK